jgi:hypothetical protein
MAGLQYQVLVRSTVNGHGLRHYFASIPDLHCEGIGASATEAIEASRREALRRLRDYEGSPHTPPRPSQLSLTAVDVPAPRGHLRPMASLTTVV